MGTAVNTFTYSGGELRSYDVTSAVNAALAGGQFFAARLEANVVPASGYYGGNFLTPTLTYTRAVVGVPEPASWALMLLGFGAAGLVLRRRDVRARIGFA